MVSARSHSIAVVSDDNGEYQTAQIERIAIAESVNPSISKTPGNSSLRAGIAA
ncbi:MAG: hypothetical protein AAFR26_08755 [Cyanobacteria bacterium J06626_4]